MQRQAFVCKALEDCINFSNIFQANEGENVVTGTNISRTRTFNLQMDCKFHVIAFCIAIASMELNMKINSK